MKKELYIIGAGLSGIYAALELEAQFNVTILEASERPGGRIRSIEGLDLGPSWIWPHQKRILDLVAKLKLELLPQYTRGLALYDSPSGSEKFDPAPQPPSARVQGGVEKLVERLLLQLKSSRILYRQEIKSLSYENRRIKLSSEREDFTADYVIVTAPPRVALQIAYDPPLDLPSHNLMQATPTWMAHTAKCVVTYESAFWREEGLSGFGFSHLGPLSEIHDSSTKERKALFGFFHSKAATDNEAVIDQLVRMFGEKAAQFRQIYTVDWRNQPYTASLADREPLAAHPRYGLDISHFDGRLLFAGTESAFEEGGYLEGALSSAAKTAALLKGYR